MGAKAGANKAQKIKTTSTMAPAMAEISLTKL
jgi:hypothetical protein